MLVESLVASSHEFSLSFHFVFEIYQKTTNTISSMFPTSSCFTILLFSFFLFFSFDSLKHGRNFNTHVNILVKLLSPPVPVNSTCLASMLRKYRGSQSTHTLNIDFKTYTFCVRFSLDHWCTGKGELPGVVWYDVHAQRIREVIPFC